MSDPDKLFAIDELFEASRRRGLCYDAKAAASVLALIPAHLRRLVCQHAPTLTAYPSAVGEVLRENNVRTPDPHPNAEFLGYDMQYKIDYKHVQTALTEHVRLKAFGDARFRCELKVLAYSAAMGADTVERWAALPSHIPLFCVEAYDKEAALTKWDFESYVPVRERLWSRIEELANAHARNCVAAVKAASAPAGGPNAWFFELPRTNGSLAAAFNVVFRDEAARRGWVAPIVQVLAGPWLLEADWRDIAGDSVMVSVAARPHDVVDTLKRDLDGPVDARLVLWDRYVAATLTTG